MLPKVRVGRITLNESYSKALSDSGDRKVKISGVEMISSRGLPTLRARVVDLANSYGMMVPVVFENKTDWNGYYIVDGVDPSYTEWGDQGVGIIEWSLELQRFGSDNDIDIESRLTGGTPLLNDFAGAGEIWHAPPIGHAAYWSGPSAPGQVVRVTRDGPITVYRNVDADTNPRFVCSPENYSRGRCRFIDSNGVERVGTNFDTDAVGWEINNGLVSVQQGGSGTFRVGTWGTGFEFKSWNVLAPSALAAPVGVSVLRNDYECTVVRLLWNVSPSGRVTADLTLRRGSRFVEVYVQSMLSATLGISAATPEAGTVTGGYMFANAADADGNKYLIGSARSFTGDGPNGKISKATSVKFDAFIGVGTAVDGDEPADVYQQYLGSPAERVTGVRI